MLKALARPRGRLRPRAVAAVTAATLVSVSALTMSAPQAASAATPTASGDYLDDAQSPAIAADAPWTKTVTYLVSKMTPADYIALMRAGSDPNPHGAAGYIGGVPRLGVPAFRLADALGINVLADATAFPSRLGVSAAFDRSLLSKLGQEEGRQGLDLGVDLEFGPQVDLARYPSWSRNFTTQGEDAYMSAEFAREEINGIQSQGLMSQVKHISFYNGQKEVDASLIGGQAAHELYLPALEAAVREAGVSSAMCSYANPQIIGEDEAPTFSCSNSNLLNRTARDLYGLKGFVTSDFTAAKATSDLLAGMDMEFITQFFSAANLVPLIDSTSSQYDAKYAKAAELSAARILYQLERFGRLDNSKIPEKYQSSVPQTGDVTSLRNTAGTDRERGGALALKLSEQSAVLLKNDKNALPLSKTGKVAVVGPTATLMPAAPGGERSRGFGERNTYTPLKAMAAEVGNANLTSAPGIDWIGTTVPAAALTQDEAGTVPGLLRTTVTNDPNPVTTTTSDSAINGKQTNLTRGYRYSWTGYVNAPADDTYQFLLQRPNGTDSGNASAYNGGVRSGSAGAVSLSIDGAAQTLANPNELILPNDFPDGTRASNGQYLGKDNTGASVPLTAGRHKVTFTYNPSANSAQAPTLRLAWAPKNANLAAAVQAAQTADTTVLFVSSTSAGNGDNASVISSLATLGPGQDELVNAVADAAKAAGKRVVVVLNSGAAVAMPWLDKIDSLVEMWYPGEEGGTATSNVLYGKVNPSGKLTISFPKNDDSTPFSGHPERTSPVVSGTTTTPALKWSEGINLGYRWYTNPQVNTADVDPLFPFGFGLSYSSYKYSGLSTRRAADGGLNVSFTVTNTGDKDGADSPQVYIGESPDLPGPKFDGNEIAISGFEQSPRKLVQFDKVNLSAGESKTVTLKVPVRQLSAWDTVKHEWVLGTGNRRVELGHSSEDIAAATTTNIVANAAAPTIVQDLPATTTAAKNGAVTLSAKATGTPDPTVRWQRSVAGTDTWVDIPGAVSTTYSFDATGMNGERLRAVFSNELGDIPTSATTLRVAKVKAKARASLVKKKVTSDRRAKVRVRVTAPKGLPATGKVTVDVRSGGKSRGKVNGTIKGGKVTITLPKLKKGSYSVVATYRGNNVLTPTKAKAVRLKVVKR